MTDRLRHVLLTWAFRYLEDAAVRGEGLAQRVRLAEFAASFAKYSGCGGLVSRRIEQMLLSEAAALDGGNDVVPTAPDAVLMVMTEALFFGGHTRVVERWIEGDDTRRYSLLLTRQATSDVPARLQSAVRKSGGVLLSVADGEIGDRALRLRRLSAGYGAVVLFTHWDDALPLLAYGREDFPRPVGLFNHADHVFWLGVSVADAIGELRHWGGRLSEECRGTAVSRVLTIPGDAMPLTVRDRAAVRAALGVRPKSRLVVAAGAAYKFRPVSGLGFADVVACLLRREREAELVVIGAGPDDFPDGPHLIRRFDGRLRLLARMPHAQMMDWLAAADVVLGSLPVPGFTVMADALSCGRPVLMCETPGGLMDWMTGSAALCGSVDELVDRTCRLLHDPDESERVWRETWRRLQDADSPDAFRRRMNGFFAALAESGHRLHAIGSVRPLSARFAHFLMQTGAQWLDMMTENRCLGLFGKWQLPNVVLRCRQKPQLTPWLLLRWAIHGCR